MIENLTGRGPFGRFRFVPALLGLEFPIFRLVVEVSSAFGQWRAVNTLLAGSSGVFCQFCSKFRAVEAILKGISPQVRKTYLVNGLLCPLCV